FRETAAEFKRFRIGTSLGGDVGPASAALRKTIEGLSPHGKPAPEIIDSLAADANTPAMLRERARSFEQQAAQLRSIAAAVQQRRVRDELKKALSAAEDKIDLAHAALLVAKLDNDEIDVAGYHEELDRMGRKLAAGLAKDADNPARLKALNNFFFTE